MPVIIISQNYLEMWPYVMKFRSYHISHTFKSSSSNMCMISNRKGLHEFYDLLYNIMVNFMINR